MRIFYLSLAALALALPIAARADTVIFPPVGCTSDSQQAITYQENAPNTYCTSSKDIVSLALKNMNCAEGQSLSLNAKKELSCKSSTSSAGWWSGFFIRSHITTSNMHNCAPKCTGCQTFTDGQDCPVERGCVHFVDPDGSHGWRDCKIPAEKIIISCPTSGGTTSVPLNTEYLYRCTEPHLDTGGCTCPQGTSPVLYKQDYDTMACTGGYMRTYKCK